MLFTKVLAPVAFLATAVLADGAAIVDALNAIAADTAALNNTVIEWKSDLLGSLPIIAKSTSLLATINKGTKTAEDSAPLELLETLGVAQATQALVADVNTTLTTIISRKSDFDHLLLSPVVLLNLELEKKASADFSDAVTAKVPADVQSIAEQLAAQINDAFVEAIDVYNGPF